MCAAYIFFSLSFITLDDINSMEQTVCDALSITFQKNNRLPEGYQIWPAKYYLTVLGWIWFIVEFSTWTVLQLQLNSIAPLVLGLALECRIHSKGPSCVWYQNLAKNLRNKFNLVFSLKYGAHFRSGHSKMAAMQFSRFSWNTT